MNSCYGCTDLWNGWKGDGVQGRVVQQVGFLSCIYPIRNVVISSSIEVDMNYVWITSTNGYCLLDNYWTTVAELSHSGVVVLCSMSLCTRPKVRGRLLLSLCCLGLLSRLSLFYMHMKSVLSILSFVKEIEGLTMLDKAPASQFNRPGVSEYDCFLSFVMDYTFWIENWH